MMTRVHKSGNLKIRRDINVIIAKRAIQSFEVIIIERNAKTILGIETVQDFGCQQVTFRQVTLTG